MKCVSCASLKFKNAKLQERLDDANKQHLALKQSNDELRDAVERAKAEVKFTSAAVSSLQLKLKSLTTNKGAAPNEDSRSN